VRKVYARDVEALGNEPAKLFRRRGRRADGGHDLGAAEIQVFVVKVDIEDAGFG
jgi:hypothetical protein